jgi:hypothetical protein
MAKLEVTEKAHISRQSESVLKRRSFRFFVSLFRLPFILQSSAKVKIICGEKKPKSHDGSANMKKLFRLSLLLQVHFVKLLLFLSFNFA